jgi:hypothetical protein
MPNIHDDFRAEFEAADAIFVERQAKYGPGNIARTGLLGIAVRLNDKVERLLQLTLHGSGGTATDESVEDTLRDVANYGLIGLMLLHKTWPEAAQNVLADYRARTAKEALRASTAAQVPSMWYPTEPLAERGFGPRDPFVSTTMKDRD